MLYLVFFIFVLIVEVASDVAATSGRQARLGHEHLEHDQTPALRQLARGALALPDTFNLPVLLETRHPAAG